MTEGVVKSYDQDRGQGINKDDEGEELTVHRTGLAEEEPGSLFPGDIVEFTKGRNKWGRPAALNVKKIGWEDENDDSEPKEWTF